MATVKTYDEKSWELAKHFLEGDPDLAHLATTDRLEQLALEIQQTVEDWIAYEANNYDGAPTA